MRRFWRGNGQTVTSVVFGPDEMSVETQERLTRLTNPAGPQSQGTAMHRFQGDAGYGENRFAGALPHALQDFRGAAVPLAHPESAQLGYGLGGVSGGGAMPYTSLPGIDGSLAAMSEA
jgi:hypothetical protein